LQTVDKNRSWLADFANYTGPYKDIVEERSYVVRGLRSADRCVVAYDM